MRVRTILVAVAFMLAPLTGRAADLVVWWEEGWYPEEDRAVTELIAAFEAKTGKEVELVRQPHDARVEVTAALEAGHPPDFLWGLGGTAGLVGRWALEGRLANLTEAVGPLREMFDADALEHATLPNSHTGGRALYALPMGRSSNHVHVWTGLLERAGFTLADVPREWGSFWSFWCDKVQPAVRKALGRDDVWGVALPMSREAGDTSTGLEQFAWAFTPYRPLPAGWSLADTPAARAILIEALRAYAAIHVKGCTPPDAVGWTNGDNNKAFLERRVVMVTNPTLSIVNALREARPDDYHKDAATIGWPSDAFGRPLTVVGDLPWAVIFRDGGHTTLALEFVHFLVADGWLARWLDFAADRILPPMRGLVDRPFWLDPGDPHRMRAAVQTLTQPHWLGWWSVPLDQEPYFRAAEPGIYETAVHRVVVEGWSPEQAADEAIARFKQLLSE
jgi:multiple sugar transport system substrate-binding protein